MNEIIQLLSGIKFTLHSEKELQVEICNVLNATMQVTAEYPLDRKNIIDFYCDGIGIEVKIKGGRKIIFKQCERYCAFDEIKALILVTNRAIGFPSSINNKPCAVVNLGLAWL